MIHDPWRMMHHASCIMHHASCIMRDEVSWIMRCNNASCDICGVFRVKSGACFRIGVNFASIWYQTRDDWGITLIPRGHRSRTTYTNRETLPLTLIFVVAKEGFKGSMRNRAQDLFQPLAYCKLPFAYITKSKPLRTPVSHWTGESVWGENCLMVHRDSEVR